MTRELMAVVQENNNPAWMEALPGDPLILFLVGVGLGLCGIPLTPYWAFWVFDWVARWDSWWDGWRPLPPWQSSFLFCGGSEKDSYGVGKARRGQGRNFGIVSNDLKRMG